MEKAFQVSILEKDETLRGIFPEIISGDQFRVNCFAVEEALYDNVRNDICNICVIDIYGVGDASFMPLFQVKSIKPDLPVIVLTSSPLQGDVNQAFYMGADDVVRKPFNVEELKARIAVILRRTGEMQKPVIRTMQIGIFTLDLQKRLLIAGTYVKRLTTKEYDLLKLLAEYKGEVVEREVALKAVWGDQSYFSARCMDVYITKLRKILRGDPAIELINVHGKGYRLVVTDPMEME